MPEAATTDGRGNDGIRHVASTDPEHRPGSSAEEAQDGSQHRLPGRQRKPRSIRACVICNKRKIRCNLAQTGTRCDNCRHFGYECVPHERKRKFYAVIDCENPSHEHGGRPRKKAISISTSDAPVQEAQRRSVNTESSVQPATPEETLDYIQNALVAQFGEGNDTRPTLSSPGRVSQSFETTVAHDPSPRAAGYLGRSSYVGGELLDQEDSTVKDSSHVPHSSLTADDMKVLEIRTAFDLALRATCESLISTFMTKCDPWMPVLSSLQMEKLQQGEISEVPLLLLQAVLMAGARMQIERSPLQNVSAQQLYDRAKVLFFMGYEKDPMILLSAVAILQYWNPTGPGHVSIHSSSYWLRVGVGLVHQMGLHKEPDRSRPDCHLRRRIFWTLFARDSLLSMGQGRPRAIHLEDCSVDWPKTSDFPATHNKHAELFIAHVRISGILGDLTQWSLRGGSDVATKRALFQQQLITWAESLPDHLRICQSNGKNAPYDSYTRQLMLPYLTATSILYKPKLPSRANGGGSQPTIASAIAASHMSRIFEDALARNEVRDGVAIQAIYLLFAGISLLATFEYPLLYKTSCQDMEIIKLSLEELSKTWQTAKESRRVLQSLQEAVSAFPRPTDRAALQPDEKMWRLFQPFGTSFSNGAQVIADQWEKNPTFLDPSAPESNIQTSSEDSNCGAGMADFTLGLAGSIATNQLGDEVGDAVDFSPQTMMDNVLQDIMAQSHFSGEDWFFRDM